MNHVMWGVIKSLWSTSCSFSI